MLWCKLCPSDLTSLSLAFDCERHGNAANRALRFRYPSHQHCEACDILRGTLNTKRFTRDAFHWTSDMPKRMVKPTVDRVGIPRVLINALTTQGRVQRPCRLRWMLAVVCRPTMKMVYVTLRKRKRPKRVCLDRVIAGEPLWQVNMTREAG